MIQEGGQGGRKNKETFSLSMLFWEIQKLPVLESSLEPTEMSLLATFWNKNGGRRPSVHRIHILFIGDSSDSRFHAINPDLLSGKKAET